MTDQPAAPGPVVLELAATTAGVAVVRATVGAVVAGLGATVDDVDDVRVAASEVVTLLLQRAAPGARITVVIEGSRDAVRVEGSVAVSVEAEPVEGTFGWTVLTALAPGSSTSSTDGVLTCGFTHRPTVPA
jgi:serine/threonine-protein kinase RsbW